MRIARIVTALAIGFAPHTAAMGAGISNHGDTLRLVFADARDHASHIVTRMHPNAFARSADEGVKAWVLKNKDALAADILASPHEWVSQESAGFTTCAKTLAPESGDALPTRAPIVLYFPLCRGTANFKDAAALLIHESVHHFAIADEAFADAVALAVTRAWEQNALDWELFGDAQTAPALEQSSAVWTGSEMLVFGGSEDQGGHKVPSNALYAYNPASNRWRALSSAGAPAVFGHAAFWTGEEMVVWGGFLDDNRWVNGGAVYNAKSDSWRSIAPAGGPATIVSLDNRYVAVQGAAWTGKQLAVWGGELGRGQGNPGGLYDPTTNRWESITSSGAPERVRGHSVTYADGKLYVWGGLNRAQQYTNDGAVYDVAARAWTAIPATQAAPGARYGHSAVWANDRLVIFSGIPKDRGENPSFATGGVFDPATGAWKRFAAESVMERTGHQAVWTGSEMLVHGGRSNTFINFLADVSAFDPISLTWRSISKPNAPKARGNHAAVWTGNAMIIWGGRDRTAPTTTGGIFRP